LLLEGKISRTPALEALSPDFMQGGQLISLRSAPDLAAYYNHLADLDSQPADPEAAAGSYAWMVQAMAGLTPAEVIAATQAVYADNRAEADRRSGQETWVESAPGRNGYRVPFFNPEIIDLVGRLLQHGYDLYVVSGSNVWTVRQMVTVELMRRVNQRFGAHWQIPADHVIGAAVMLRDTRSGQLLKDLYLARENPRYAALDPQELKHYELTRQMVFPLTGFSGKVANIVQFITGPLERPFLVAGDSGGDFAMLRQAQHRLWFARLEKKGYQQALNAVAGGAEHDSWLIQPVLTTRWPGLIRNRQQLSELVSQPGERLKLPDLLASLEIWARSGHYRD
jgi:hypothetical protein